MKLSELRDEVLRRSTRDQGGTQFDTSANNAINSSLFRISRETFWRVLRRTDTFETETSYTTGSGNASVTNGSKSFSVTGATFLTDNIRIGRRIEFGTDSRTYEIKTITSETAGTIDRDYDGTTSTTASYEVLPTETYNLPIQATHRLFMWHNDFGSPTKLEYLTEQDFRSLGVNDTSTGTPTHYRMWGEDMVDRQPNAASVLTISSSDSSDTSVDITVFGIVSSLPDFETITTNASNGTTDVSGSKSFSLIERVVKNTSTTGRITITANSANVTVATLPVGNPTSGILYRKVSLYPLPDDVFPVKVLYYKDPWKLVNDSDVHEMGDQFDEAIILLATSKINYETSKREGDRFFQLYTDELKSLRRTNVDKVDWLPKLRRPHDKRFGHLLHRHLAFDQLGGNFGIVTRR